MYVLWVMSLIQAHRGAFLRLELTARQLLDAELSPAETKMLCLLLLSSIVALLLHQMARVAPASLWPENLDTQPPLLGAALTTAYSVLAAALAAVVYLEAVRPSEVEPFDGTVSREPVDRSAASGERGGGAPPPQQQEQELQQAQQSQKQTQGKTPSMSTQQRAGGP